MHPTCILTPLSHPGHVPSYAWDHLKRTLQAQDSWDHTHTRRTQVGTNMDKHCCVRLHGHMPVGGLGIPLPLDPGSPSPDLPHILDLSLSPGCVTKHRHREGYHWPQTQGYISWLSPSFPFSMPTYEGPCTILWAPLPSSTHLPSQNPCWAKNNNRDFWGGHSLFYIMRSVVWKRTWCPE